MTAHSPNSRDRITSKVDERVSRLERERSTTADDATISSASVRRALKRNRQYGDVALDRIDPDPDQPRSVDTDTESFRELVASVRQHGIIQPITVRWVEHQRRFQIITGERRYRAAVSAGLSDIPVVLRELDDEQRVLQQLVENIQREDMTPLQEARALQAVLAVAGDTQEQLAERIGKSQSYVAQTLSLLRKLTPAEQAEIGHHSPANTPNRSLLLEATRTSDPTTRAALLRGELTRREARVKVSQATPPVDARPKRHTERLELEDSKATVTVSFRKSVVSDQEVLDALNEARRAVRNRVRGGSV